VQQLDTIEELVAIVQATRDEMKAYRQYVSVVSVEWTMTEVVAISCNTTGRLAT